MIDVAEIYSHRSLFLSIPAQGRTGKEADLFESAVMFVVVEVVGSRVVGYVKVWPVIVVVIGPHALHSKIVIRVIHSRLFRNVFEGSVATIAKKKVRFARQSPWTTLHRNSTEFAGLVVAAKYRKLVAVHRHVARDKKIHESVPIEVSPRCAGAEAANTQSCFFRDIFELAIP